MRKLFKLLGIIIEVNELTIQVVRGNWKMKYLFEKDEEMRITVDIFLFTVIAED